MAATEATAGITSNRAGSPLTQEFPRPILIKLKALSSSLPNESSPDTHKASRDILFFDPAMKFRSVRLVELPLLQLRGIVKSYALMWQPRISFYRIALNC